MSATDELRRLLDERGVEYTDRDMFGKRVFHWGEPLRGAMFTDGGEWTELVVENAAPEQAVEATLGRRTCTNVVTDDWGAKEANHFECSECGAKVADYECYYVGVYTDEGDVPWSYCPNCGAKVVE